MAEYPIYQVDAFADSAFKGNPAAIMPLDDFLSDEMLQSIAMENNLAETAFIVKTAEGVYDLRWFTPTVEVPLCGHATLAAAHVLYTELGSEGDTLAFDTRKSGRLSVSLDGDRYAMDFPVDEQTQINIPDDLGDALGGAPREVWAGGYLLAVFDHEDQIHGLKPDLKTLSGIGDEAGWGPGHVICAAPGAEDFDVVSRFFGPSSGIDEDPATGSAHCAIAPLFSDKLGKKDLECYQAYPSRGARIGTSLRGDRVILKGQAKTVLKGHFIL